MINAIVLLSLVALSPSGSTPEMPRSGVTLQFEEECCGGEKFEAPSTFEHPSEKEVLEALRSKEAEADHLQRWVNALCVLYGEDPECKLPEHELMDLAKDIEEIRKLLPATSTGMCYPLNTE
jgi:hypothetical protein